VSDKQSEERRSPRRELSDSERRLRSAVGDVLEGHSPAEAARNRKVAPDRLRAAVKTAREGTR
jgi:hypothetical protein